jgi:hypothetical protein
MSHPDVVIADFAGLMSGEGKRSGHGPPPRPSSTLLSVNSRLVSIA